MLSLAQLQNLNSHSHVQSTFGTTRTQTNQRVVLTVLDGFRYDCTSFPSATNLPDCVLAD